MATYSKKLPKLSKPNKRIVKNLLDFLVDKDFTVHVKRADSTSSVYVKLDYGAANSIRISDHPGNENYNYRFNLMLGMTRQQVQHYMTTLKKPRYPQFFFSYQDVHLLEQAIMLNHQDHLKEGKDLYQQRIEFAKKKFDEALRRRGNSFSATAQLIHLRQREPYFFEATNPKELLTNGPKTSLL